MTTRSYPTIEKGGEMARDIGACCANIVQAQADIEASVKEIAANKEDAQRWRDQHEERNRESFERLFTRLDSIEDKLTNRVPAWVSVVFAVGGGCIGSLVTIVVMLTNHFLK